MFKEMNLNSLSFDSASGEPFVLLKDSTRSSSFLVTANPQDINFLMSEFSGTVADANSPYALIIQMMSLLQCQLDRVEIVPEVTGMYTGRILLKSGETILTQKCRPIDAVILACKLSKPVQVFSSLINQIELLTHIDVPQNDMPQERPLMNNQLCKADDKTFLM